MTTNITIEPQKADTALCCQISLRRNAGTVILRESAVTAVLLFISSFSITHLACLLLCQFHHHDHHDQHHHHHHHNHFCCHSNCHTGTPVQYIATCCHRGTIQGLSESGELIQVQFTACLYHIQVQKSFHFFKTRASVASMLRSV